MFQDIIVFTVAENLKKSLILNHFSTFVIYKYVLWKVWPKKTLFFLKKNMSQSMVLFMMFVYRCSPEKASFFAFFCCICWVCCDCPQNWWFSWCWSINAVVEFKREVSSSFSKTTQGVFSLLAAVLVKLSLFQQIQGHSQTSTWKSHSYTFYMVFKVQSSSR